MEDYKKIDEYIICPFCNVELMLNTSTNDVECPCCYTTLDDLKHMPYEEVYEDIPEGCSACGGDYPKCMSGCNMFDG